MPIPSRVREEAAEADAQLAAFVGAAAPPAPIAPTPPELSVVPPAPAPTEQPPAPAPTVQPTTPESELQRLQQQLSTEAGRRAAQDAELAELRGRLQGLQDALATQQRQPAAPAAPAPAPVNLITEDDKKDFGEDMIDFVKRMFQQQLGSTLTQFAGRLTALENSLRQTVQTAESAAQSAEAMAFDRYVGALDATIPGWRQTNEDSGFVDWLKNVDTLSRKTRQSLLADAHNAADAATVAEFFRAYWKETGTAPAPAPAPSAVTPPAAPAPPAPILDPQSLVAPTPSNAPTPVANQRAGKLWTQAEIEKVYDDRMKKRISAEDFARLELEIQTALLEGRITG